MKRTATINIELDKVQLIDIIGQLEIRDKIELLDLLRQNTFLARFQRLLKDLRTDDLSLDEITQEVEKVRQNRYDTGKHKLN